MQSAVLVYQVDCHAGHTYSHMGPIVSMQVTVIHVGHVVNMQVALHCTGAKITGAILSRRQ